ncbi:MAG: SOS response-associated peptidase [Leptolyngbyaceae bacterium]|nr:SOS response-associated peptidase [Leptolyngbyaceae bacterium]
MCGRIVSYSPVEEVAANMDATIDPIAKFSYQPSYNVPPSQPLLIVCPVGKEADHERRLLLASWGLLPHWAKDMSIAFKTFNARSETVTEKPSFRGAFKYRRCLIPVNGYYEWKRSGKAKQPYYFSRSEGNAPVVLAGLFELWRDERLTCTVITTEANPMARDVHPRMPVVLEPDHWQQWLMGSPEDAHELLRPAAENALQCYSVGDAVNSVKNDRPELIVPSSIPTSK